MFVPTQHISQVVIDRIAVRVHLCADTGSALGQYFGDFGTAFKERPKQPYVFDFIGTSSALMGIVCLSRNQRNQQLCHLRVTHWANSHVRSNHYLSTFLDVFGLDPIDQHAFRSIPEVGAAPDMINDDLPSNPDYLDVSFGTAAGLRELDDDDLDTDDSSQSELTGITNLHSHRTDKNVVSSVGGETIKVLDPSGLQTVENFFNTLPALVEASPQCVSLGIQAPFRC